MYVHMLISIAYGEHLLDREGIVMKIEGNPKFCGGCESSRRASQPSAGVTSLLRQLYSATQVRKVCYSVLCQKLYLPLCSARIRVMCWLCSDYYPHDVTSRGLLGVS